MKPVILVVDDSSIARQMAGGLIRKQTPFEVEFAWDGDDALQRLSEDRIDVVVTDLIMPGKDGLELVQEMCSHHPNIPVLLMTAYGNEEIAADALSKGASSFVPKSQLPERLAPTVMGLVNRAMTDRCRTLAGTSMTGGVFEFELPNDMVLIETVVNTIHRTMSSMEIGTAGSRIRACTALDEALSNAVLHGNLDFSEEEWATMRSSRGSQFSNWIESRSSQPQYQHRRVQLQATLKPDRAIFVVRDQGCGFDAMSHARHELRDYFDVGKDRGLTLMHSLVDAVDFSASANEVTLTNMLVTNS